MGQQTVVFVPVGYALTLTAVSAGSYFIPGNPGEVLGGHTVLDAAASVVLGPFNTPRSYSLQSGNNDMAYSLAFSGVYSAADEAISNQAAMDLKANLAGPTFTGTVGLPSTTSIGPVSATEIGYVDGVTSAIQTQMNLKAPIASPTFTGNVSIPGTITNDNAAAGKIGEYISSSVVAVATTNNTLLNVTSISLTAGDWDVSGNVSTLAAAGTIVTQLQGWISQTSASFPTSPNAGAYLTQFNTGAVANQDCRGPVGTRRISLAATTTVYLSAYVSFSISTLTSEGFIGARRVR